MTSLVIGFRLSLWERLWECRREIILLYIIYIVYVENPYRKLKVINLRKYKDKLFYSEFNLIRHFINTNHITITNNFKGSAPIVNVIAWFNCY
jgi:hypothetical protein